VYAGEVSGFFEARWLSVGCGSKPRLAQNHCRTFRLRAKHGLCGGCSTNYYTYSGSGIYEGKGGASKNVNGVDIWLVGTPPQKSRIIGYITDSRPGGLIPMARRDADLAAEAKKNGGDGPSA
jgi:hypothetical protein